MIVSKYCVLSERVVVSDLINLRNVNLTSKANNAAEDEKCTKMQNWRDY